ncbi:MAG: urea carboxylase-associated family protein [Rhizobiaceae bacterium]|nr:urea carboxylase-associated family protein [Rhizobiaceae bacterium]
MSEPTLRIEGSHAGCMALKRGELLRITNLEGSQVADLWAYALPDKYEFLSTEHTRSCLQKLVPGTGDALYSNMRHPMLVIMEDNSPGDHDMLMSACDARRYELLGHKGFHRSCTDNLREILQETGHPCTDIPSPFNTFQKVSVSPDGELEIVPPSVSAGDNIVFQAAMDLQVIVSACPMDIAMTNGPDGKTRPILLERFSK